MDKWKESETRCISAFRLFTFHLFTLSTMKLYTYERPLYTLKFFVQTGRIIMDLLSLWEKMLANLKQVLPKEIFTNWFEGNIIPYSYSEEENLLILDTMTNFLRDYVSKKYTDVLETIAEEVIGHKTRVQLITSQEKNADPRQKPKPSPKRLPFRPNKVRRRRNGDSSQRRKTGPGVPTEWFNLNCP